MKLANETISKYSRYGLTLFIIGVFFDGLSSIVFGAALIGQVPAYVVPALGAQRAIGALIVVYGLAALALTFTLIPYLRSETKELGVNELLSGRARIMVYLVMFLTLLVGITYLVGHAYIIGSLLLIAIATGIASYLIYSKSNTLSMMVGILLIITAVFVAIAGFAGSARIIGIHLGVVSIILFIAAAIAIMASLTGIGGNVVRVLKAISLIIFATSLIVGASLGIWSNIGYLRIGGAYAASASIALISSISILYPEY